jgi:hypothetical protein
MKKHTKKQFYLDKNNEWRGVGLTKKTWCSRPWLLDKLKSGTP